MIRVAYYIFIFVYAVPLLSQPHPTFYSCNEGEIISASEADAQWQLRLRSRALYKLDKVLSWALPMKERVFQRSHQHDGVHFSFQSDAMINFAKKFSYFAEKHPVISTVSLSIEDIRLSSELLRHVYTHCRNEEYLEMAVAEILAKVVAFRELTDGMIIPIPCVLETGDIDLINYRVDKVFSLWPCMPAFGLISDHPQASAILLYRGTDLSLESKRGWASVLSDLDIQGPGLTAFMKSREEIKAWLKLASHNKPRPRVIGFSLGGALALYTSVYESDLLNVKGSFAFNPPGVSLPVYKTWKELSIDHRNPIDVYVTRGDIIPKIGMLAGRVFELATEGQIGPVDAHVRLMCCQRDLYRFEIDLFEENRGRR